MAISVNHYILAAKPISYFHNVSGFTKLELMLANKIDFLKYRQFKQNASIQSQILYQRKIFKRPPLLLKILSINNRIFL